MALAAGTMIACGPKGDPQLGKDSIDDVIAAMTNEEKARFVIGTGMAGFTGEDPVIGATQNIVPGAAGTTYPIERLGIPAIVLADGPAGLRINPTREGDEQTYYCTHFPIGTLLASTWNQELVEQVGTAIGEEVLEYGADVLLAPALNIHRNPLCGRNFEYYSEDPVVTGKIAAAYVKGVQSNGVGTSIKHFAVNNQETNRMANDAQVDPRAIREIYLKGFEIAVKEAEPWTVMSSYNYINGTYASESPELLTTVLRDEWGYKGLVMTDWFGGKDGCAQMRAGNDMLQPGRADQYESIINGLNDGTLSQADIDRNIKRILELILQSPKFKGYQYDNKPDLKAHAKVTRQSATEGMVLLKNENNALPLTSEIKTISLLGCTSYDFIAGGTGSGNVNRAYTVSLFDGLKNAGYQVNEDLKPIYEKHIAKEAEINAKKDTSSLAKFLPAKRPSEIILTEEQLKSQAAKTDIALLTIGRTSGEFADRNSSDFNMTEDEIKLIESVCRVFHAAGKKVVVVLNIGGVIETASWKAMPDAILCAWQAGQEGGNSVADVLKGVKSPSGKLTMTFPIAYTDHESTKNFPVDHPLVMGAFGGEKEVDYSDVKNVGYTEYEEGIYVGYRLFDTKNIDVSYPFGYGLSYTSFEYGEASIKQAKKETSVTVTIKNTGAYPGKEIVQLYVTAPKGQLDKPVQELKAFAKTRELQPGESETLTLVVKNEDLASFDEAQSAWVVDAGTYTFKVGASSRDIKAELTADVKASTVKTNKVLLKK